MKRYQKANELKKKKKKVIFWRGEKCVFDECFVNANTHKKRA
jgi:hypothetical protein